MASVCDAWWLVKVLGVDFSSKAKWYNIVVPVGQQIFANKLYWFAIYPISLLEDAVS